MTRHRLTPDERARLQRGFEQFRERVAQERFLAWVCWCGEWHGPADIDESAPQCECGSQMRLERLVPGNELDAAKLILTSHEINRVLDEDALVLEKRRLAVK